MRASTQHVVRLDDCHHAILQVAQSVQQEREVGRAPSDVLAAPLASSTDTFG
ncbi:MAG: hypothetical protein JO353_09770 [Phycisphaerae bacterium]|nr:hypothetical protein [Phycisphaerae bacterium]